MQENHNRDELASERTLLAAERTFSAWVRAGLAGVGGGLAVARALIFQTYAHQAAAQVVSGLLECARHSSRVSGIPLGNNATARSNDHP